MPKRTPRIAANSRVASLFQCRRRECDCYNQTLPRRRAAQPSQRSGNAGHPSRTRRHRQRETLFPAERKVAIPKLIAMRILVTSVPSIQTGGDFALAGLRRAQVLRPLSPPAAAPGRKARRRGSCRPPSSAKEGRVRRSVRAICWVCATLKNHACTTPSASL